MIISTIEMSESIYKWWKSFKIFIVVMKEMTTFESSGSVEGAQSKLMA